MADHSPTSLTDRVQSSDPATQLPVRKSRRPKNRTQSSIPARPRGFSSGRTTIRQFRHRLPLRRRQLYLQPQRQAAVNCRHRVAINFFNKLNEIFVQSRVPFFHLIFYPLSLFHSFPFFLFIDWMEEKATFPLDYDLISYCFSTAPWSHHFFFRFFAFFFKLSFSYFSFSVSFFLSQRTQFDPPSGESPVCLVCVFYVCVLGPCRSYFELKLEK